MSFRVSLRVVKLQVGVEGIGLDLVPDLRGVALHPRVAAVSAFAVVFGHVGLLAAQGTGPGVHGAAPGVGAALQPRMQAGNTNNIR